jgi:hypothetical protein
MWNVLLQRAIEAGQVEFEARAVWGLATANLYSGSPLRARSYIERYCELVDLRGDRASRILAERYEGAILHMLGEQTAAQTALESFIDHYVRSEDRFVRVGHLWDHSVMATALLAKVMWLQGRPATAQRLSAQAESAARLQGLVIPLCYVLLESAIPLACLSGRWDDADQALRTLEEVAARAALAIWQAGGRCARLALQAARGAPVVPEDIREALIAVHTAGFTVHVTWLSCLLAGAAIDQDQALFALELLDRAMEHAEQAGERWCVPEILRLQYLAAEQQSALRPEYRSDDLLIRALDLARAQNAVRWEIRLAPHLARRRGAQGKLPEGREILREALARLLEDEIAPDLQSARQLLDDL